jgi:hypothetical protein
MQPAQFLPLAGILLGLLCLLAAYRKGQKRRLVENLPTSKTTGIFIGLVEVKASAETSQPLCSYLAEADCVYYHYTIQEHWSRTVTETYTDSDGKQKTRTRQESGWATVDEQSQMVPFYLKDECGVILVRPEGANIEPLGMFEETCHPGDPIYYGKGPAAAIGDSDFRRRFTEVGIPLHTPLYVVGQARERTDVVAAEIAQDKEAPLFLISTRSEESVTAGLKWGQRGWNLVSLLLTLAGFVGADACFHRPLQSGWPVYAMVGGVFVFFATLIWIWMVYNSFVDVKQRVTQAWSLVDIQLKRRHDLIPNLLEIVKGLKNYEATLQPELASLRTQMSATPPGVAGPDFRAVKMATIAIAENCPELKTEKAFSKLQQSLIETEQRIALARCYYNEIATHFNTRLETVPERYVAALGGMKPAVLMGAEGFERAPVAVDFGAAAA